MTNEERNIEISKLMQENIIALQNETKELKKGMDIITTEMNGRLDTVEKVMKDNNIIASPTHKALCSRFKKSSAKRIYELLGDNTSIEFCLFAPFLFKDIYASIAEYLDLPSWQYISMEDYTKCGSDYEKAKSFRDSYKPSYYYIIEKIDELKKKRDLGLLPAERCRALTEFLDLTNNGKDIWFVK